MPWEVLSTNLNPEKVLADTWGDPEKVRLRAYVSIHDGDISILGYDELEGYGGPWLYNDLDQIMSDSRIEGQDNCILLFQGVYKPYKVSEFGERKGYIRGTWSKVDIDSLKFERLKR